MQTRTRALSDSRPPSLAGHPLSPPPPVAAAPAEGATETFSPSTNWEALAVEFQAADLKHEDLLSFPEDDYTVHTTTATPRVERSALTQEDITRLEPYTREAMRAWMGPWTVVHRRYEEMGRGRPPFPSRDETPPMSEQVYVADMPEEAVPDGGLTPLAALVDGASLEHPLDFDLLAHSGKKAAKERSRNRLPVFALFTDRPASLDVAPSNSRELGDPLVSACTGKIEVEVHSFLFAVGEVEPLFCSLALHNKRTRQKVSENFYFNLNSGAALAMLGDHLPADRSLRSRVALFAHNLPIEDLWLVIRVEKVLQGELEEVAEPYCRFDRLRGQEALRTAAQQFCARLGRYQQSLAWAAIPLQQEAAKKGSRRVIDAFFRADEKEMADACLYDFFDDIRDGNTRKLKTIAGTMELHVREFADSYRPAGVVTPSLELALPIMRPHDTDAVWTEQYDEDRGHLTYVNTATKERTDWRPSDNIRPLHGSELIHDMEMLAVARELPWQRFVNNLYVYPDSADLSKAKGPKSRSVGVRVQLMASDEGDALPAVYGRFGQSQLLTQGDSAVQFHNKSPAFHDEFKIELPAVLTPRHHLLFTFFTVAVEESKKKDAQLETPLGYAVLPLYSANMIIDDGEHPLPLMESLPPRYLTGDKHPKLLDGGKLLFHVRIVVVSSIHVSGSILQSFLRAAAPDTPRPDVLQAALLAIPKARRRDVVRAAPALLTTLLALVCSPAGWQVGTLAFKTALYVASCVTRESPDPGTNERNSILVAYVNHNYRESGPTRLGQAKEFLYDKLLRTWTNVLASEATGDPQEAGIPEAWFLFELTIKSMTLFCQTPAATGMPRKLRFKDEAFVSLLKYLACLIRERVETLSKTGLVVATALNRSFALFCRDLFPLTDRGTVYDLIQQYVREFSVATHELWTLKFAFLRVVCDYEHYVILSLPVERPLKDPSHVVEEWWARHCLAGLVLSEVRSALQSEEKGLREQAASVLRDLLFRHQFDPRYGAGGRMKRVANMYFPIIPIAATLSPTFARRDSEEMRSFLVCVVWVLFNVSRRLVEQWWTKAAEQTRLEFLDLLVCCLTAFEYKGRQRLLERILREESCSIADHKSALESLYAAHVSGSFRANTLTRKRLATLKGAPRRVAKRGPVLLQANDDDSADPHLDPWACLLETNLATEVSLTVLDTLDEFVGHFQQAVAVHDGVNATANKLFSVLVRFLESDQCERTMACLFAFLRSLLHTFPAVVFLSNTTYCSDMTTVVLKHCNSLSGTIRQQAVALLYLMMRINFKSRPERPEFTRMKLQTTTSLSKLVGEKHSGAEGAGHAPPSPARLGNALAAVTAYASRDADVAQTAFVEQVRALMERLHDILRNSAKFQTLNGDPDMQGDLLLRIAEGYTHAPELRLTWLGNLLAHQKECGNTMEAAMAAIHRAALIAEYLNALEPRPAYPKGCVDFSSMTTNALDEQSASETDSTEGIVDDAAFSSEGLVKELQAVVQELVSATMWEHAVEAHRLLMPIFQAHRAYRLLSSAHGTLAKLYDRIACAAENNSPRMLGSYYRVRLFGRGFEDLHGREFVYREPGITFLPEVSQRLTTTYRKKFGEGKFEIIQNSNDVDEATLSPDVNYAQLTFVEPYWEVWEQKQRVTEFERRVNITRFVFETPFTNSGKVHAISVRDQCKRRTVLSVVRPFPYLVKRVEVVERQHVDLNPIENATEEIERKVERIAAELRGPPSIKTLQMQLQGAVRLQVNAGPLEIARVFLGPEREQYPLAAVQRLQSALREFLVVCHQALRLNATLIGDDQRLYHEDLQLGFTETMTTLTPYIFSDPSLPAKLGVSSDPSPADACSSDDEDGTTSPRSPRDSHDTHARRLLRKRPGQPSSLIDLRIPSHAVDDASARRAMTPPARVAPARASTSAPTLPDMGQRANPTPPRSGAGSNPGTPVSPRESEPVRPPRDESRRLAAVPGAVAGGLLGQAAETISMEELPARGRELDASSQTSSPPSFLGSPPQVIRSPPASIPEGSPPPVAGSPPRGIVLSVEAFVDTERRSVAIAVERTTLVAQAKMAAALKLGLRGATTDYVIRPPDGEPLLETLTLGSCSGGMPGRLILEILSSQ